MATTATGPFNSSMPLSGFCTLNSSSVCAALELDLRVSSSVSLAAASEPDRSEFADLRPGTGVAVREADRREDDITSYLKCSANEFFGRRSFGVESSCNTDLMDQMLVQKYLDEERVQLYLQAIYQNCWYLRKVHSVTERDMVSPSWQ